jgi:sugar lactone lactonase YvrE
MKISFSIAVRWFAFFAVALFCNLSLAGTDEYRFDLLWPALTQPWYFNSPNDIETDGTFVYLADTNNKRIAQFTLDGRFVSQFNLLPGDPVSLAVGKDNVLHVINRGVGAGQVRSFDSNGSLVAERDIPDYDNPEFAFANGFGFDVDDSGNFYIVARTGGPFLESPRVLKYSPQMAFIMEIGEGQLDRPANPSSSDERSIGPSDISVSTTTLYVAHNPAGSATKILAFNLDGTFRAEIPLDHLSTDRRVFGLHATDEDTIYYHDQRNDRVDHISQTGVLINRYPGNGYCNCFSSQATNGLTVSDDGTVYSVDKPTGAILRNSPSGPLLDVWGPGLVITRLGPIEATSNSVFATSNRKENDFGSGVLRFDLDGRLEVAWDAYRSPSEQSIPHVFDLDVDETRDEVALLVNSAISPGVDIIILDNGSGSASTLPTGRLFQALEQPEEFDLIQRDLDRAADGTFFVLESHDLRNEPHLLYQFSENGELLNTLVISTPNASGEEARPSDFKIAADGNFHIITGEILAQKIFVFSPGGTLLRQVTPEVDETSNQLTIDPATGDYYVGEFRLDSDGKLIQQLGDFGVSAGQFALSSNIRTTITGGRVYTADEAINRIQRFTTEPPTQSSAVVVVGGGPYPGNDLWPTTRQNAALAVRALSQRGVSKSNLVVLSHDLEEDLDGNGLGDDVDFLASNDNLKAALESVQGADEVVIYLVDHGGDKVFRMAEDETLGASELGGWISQLEATVGDHLTIVYDACQSGSFLDELGSTGDKSVTIASTESDQPAYFVEEGGLSFSSHFWTEILEGSTVGEAYEVASDITVASFPNQKPLIDADGDGTPNSSTDLAATVDRIIGDGGVRITDRPTIATITPTQTLVGENSATITVTGVADGDGIARAWAVIRPPLGSAPRDPGDPVTELPKFDLEPVDEDKTEWSGTFDGFSSAGTYTVIVYASDELGYRGLPAVTTVSVESPKRRFAVLVETELESLDGSDVNGSLGPASRANQALLAQGYSNNDIIYLSPFSNPGVDGPATQTALQASLDPAAVAGSVDLTLVLVGEIDNSGSFPLSDGALASGDLASLLDDAQAEVSGIVSVVIEGNGAGRLIADLAGSPSRILVAGAGVGQDAILAADGRVSFSQAFWSEVEFGATVLSANQSAKAFLQNSPSPQLPVLDDDGNGIGNQESDGDLSSRYRIGSGLLIAGDSPTFGDITAPSTLSGTTTGTITVQSMTSTNAISLVVAVITPPGYFNSADPAPTKPVVQALVRLAGPRYRLVFEDFSIQGEYQVALYAIDDRGQVSPPAQISVVQSAGAEVPGFTVDASISGTWFDPSHDGEGWLIQVLDATSALIYWFTYEPDDGGGSRQAWIGAQLGRIEGPNIITEGSLTTFGPEFGDGFDTESLQLVPWGDFTFSFTSCTDGTMYYAGRDDYQQGQLSLARLSSLAGLTCGSSRVEKGSSLIDGRMSGAWFDSSHSGEGWLLEILEGAQQALTVWFTYDDQGRQRWLIALGQVDGSTINFADVLEPVGAHFGPGFNPIDVNRSRWGSMQFQFNSCNSGNMTYQAVDPVDGSGTLQLEPLTKIDGQQCNL